MVEIQDYSFTYPDGTVALRNVSLRIESGERIALLGPNGAGKSTLMLHLNGIHRADDRVRLFGEPITRQNVQSVRRRVGLVFQNPDDQLFCPTVYDDVAFGPRNLGYSEEETKRRVKSSLGAVGLEGCERKSAFHLSLGQKKRAALATVLAMDVELFVLDEPTSNLEPRGKRETVALLRNLPGTMLLATHDLAMARDLCPRAVVMNAGTIVASGDIHEILADARLLDACGLR